MTLKKLKENIPIIVAILIAIILFGLAVHERNTEWNNMVERVEYLEKENRQAHERYVTSKENFMARLNASYRKIHELEQSNELLTDHIRLKQLEVEEWKSWQ